MSSNYRLEEADIIDEGVTTICYHFFFYHILINVFEPLVATETNFHMKHNLLHYDKDYHNITYRYVITLLGTSTCSRFVPLVIRKPKDKLTEYKGTCDIIPTQCIIYTCIYIHGHVYIRT